MADRLVLRLTVACIRPCEHALSRNAAAATAATSAAALSSLRLRRRALHRRLPLRDEVGWADARQDEERGDSRGDRDQIGSLHDGSIY